jgi:putative transposase
VGTRCLPFSWGGRNRACPLFPEIFNTDQGSQFTSPRFVDVLKDAGARVSMDGRGRWMDNVFIERLWRSLKYECVYIHAFETGSELRTGLTKWIGYYNTNRPHSALAGATPDEAYGQIQAPPYPGLAPDRANPEHKLAA